MSINVDSCQSQMVNEWVDMLKNPIIPHCGSRQYVDKLNQSVWSEPCWRCASFDCRRCPCDSPLPSPALIYSRLVLFLCDLFSQSLPRTVCLAPGFKRAILCWIPAELSKAVPRLAQCTIEDHERHCFTVLLQILC